MTTPSVDQPDTRTLIARSSLGEAGAMQLRRRTSQDRADEIVNRSKEIDQSHGSPGADKEVTDLDRSRLLLDWLSARRNVDEALSDLLSAGPMGERRVREALSMVDDLERRAQMAFERYRAAAENHERPDRPRPARDPSRTETVMSTTAQPTD